VLGIGQKACNMASIWCMLQAAIESVLKSLLVSLPWLHVV